MDIHTLARLVERTNELDITPRYRNLKDGDILDTSRGNMATKADTEAEARLTADIMKRDPAAFVFGEEAYKENAKPFHERDLTKGRVYFLDPLDGTYHFMRGEPHFGTLAAIAENGRITGAIIHCPIMQVTVTAMAGQGVYVNHQRVPAITAEDKDKTDFVHVLQYADMEGEAGAAIRAHMETLYSVCNSEKNRIFSVAARMAAMVTNTERGFCEASSGYYTPWDYAAPLLIMHEMDGFIWQEKVADPLGFMCPRPQRLVLATSKTMGAKARDHLQAFTFSD